MHANFAHLLEQNLRHLQLIVPELLVMAGFLCGLLMDFAVPEERRKTTGYVCLVFLLGALCVNVLDMNRFMTSGSFAHKTVQIHMDPSQPDASVPKTVTKNPEATVSTPLFCGMIARDSYGTYFKFVLLLGTLISILIALHARELRGPNQGEFFLLLTATCLGGMFLCSATNLLMLYLALESLSVISYALAGYLRQDRKSAEAGMKYVIYGAMASGIMIFGMSYVYGITGTLDLAGPQGIAARWHDLRLTESGWVARGGLLAVLALVFTGFLYKIAAAPFHYWSPDVYEGAPTPATAFFSVVPKAAGFAALLRVLLLFYPQGGILLPGQSLTKMEMTLGAVAVLTMCVGNLAALGQSNAKRMLAYSSIAHAGYMLAGFSALDSGREGYSDGPAAVLYYLLVYLFMNLGAFLVLVALENIRGSCELKDLRGTIRREPLLGVALVVFLFSLTGFPPLAGFSAKYMIFLKLADRGSWFLVVMIGLNSVVSLFYYMRLAKAVAIDPPEASAAAPESAPPVFGFLALGKVAALILLFIYFEPVMNICRQVIEPLK